MSDTRRRPTAKEANQRCVHLAARQFGVISFAQARQAGMSARSIQRRVAAREWEVIYPTAYLVRPAPRTWRASLMAATLWAGGGAVVSHRAAAALFGLEGVEGNWVELTRPVAKRSSQPGVIMHTSKRLPASHLTKLGAIPVTRVSRTLIDLAWIVDEENLEITLDSALRGGRTSMARLRAALGEIGGNGTRGCQALRRLLDQRDPSLAPPESVMETKVARLIRIAGLPAVTPQFHVVDDSGVVGRIDFAYPERKLLIEAHSFKFHISPEQWRRDVERWNRLRRAGWRIVLVTWDDVCKRPEKVIADIRAELAREQPSFF